MAQYNPPPPILPPIISIAAILKTSEWGNHFSPELMVLHAASFRALLEYRRTTGATTGFAPSLPPTPTASLASGEVGLPPGLSRFLPVDGK